MAVPVSFFQRERASLELAVGWVCGAAGGDWHDDTGDSPDTTAIISSYQDIFFQISIELLINI